MTSWACDIAQVSKFGELSEMLSDPMLQDLFRIFSCLCESVPSPASSSCQRLSYTSLQIICSLLSKTYPVSYSDADPICILYPLACPCIWKWKLERSECNNRQFYNFREMLAVLNKHFPDKKRLIPATEEVTDTIVYNVIKKGLVFKRMRGCGLSLKNPWIPFWCVISPGKLSLNSIPVKNNNKIVVVLTQNSTVSVTDKRRSNRSRWVVSNGKLSLTLASLDPSDTCLWITAVLEAAHSQTLPSIRTCILNHKFNKFRIPCSFHAQISPSNEPNKIQNLIARFRKRIIELEAELEEQKLATKDEETVRRIATRMLDEERTLKEQAMKLQKESMNGLDEERIKRNKVEVLHKQRSMEIIALKEHLINLTQQLKTHQNAPSPSDTIERRKLLDQLLTDSELMLEHQKSARNGDLEEQQEHGQLMAESGQKLQKLMLSSRQRHSSSSTNGSLIEINKILVANKGSTSSSRISSPTSSK